MLPHDRGAVRGPQGRLQALPGQELRRLQRDLLAAGLPEPRPRGAHAGRPEAEVHQDLRREAVVAGADGERGAGGRPGAGWVGVVELCSFFFLHLIMGVAKRWWLSLCFVCGGSDEGWFGRDPKRVG